MCTSRNFQTEPFRITAHSRFLIVQQFSRLFNGSSSNVRTQYNGGPTQFLNQKQSAHPFDYFVVQLSTTGGSSRAAYENAQIVNCLVVRSVSGITVHSLSGIYTVKMASAEETLDIEVFINLVEVRPALYMKNLKEYSDIKKYVPKYVQTGESRRLKRK